MPEPPYSLIIWVSYRKSLSNESQGKINELKALGLKICNYQDEQNLSIDKWDVIIVQVESLSRIEFSARPIVAVLDEVNAIQRQMNSGANARESENAMRDLLKSAVHVLAMDAFGNESTLAFLKAYRGENIRVIDNKFQPLIGKTIEYLPDPNSGAEAMRIGFEFLKQGKRVAFVVTSSNMARALVKEASKLSFKARAYYGDMDGKQRKKDFLDINTAWGELDCVAYTNTVEAGISFEKPNHFDIVIGITNIETPVNVEAFIQMMFRIRDCEKRILSLYYQKISNELSRPPGHENIRAELAVARPNDVPTAIKGHREWDKDSISYKLDQSPAVISFIEVEHRKRLSARNFIEISCSLIASTGASLKLIKMDENQEIIGNRKKVCNEIKAEALVIKNTDFEAVATSRNLIPEEAEFLKLDQERSVADTMALKRFYMWNLYGGNMSNETWNKLCNKEFVERFCPPEPRKHFLRLSYFRKQGYDEDSAIEGLKAKDIAQWEDTCHNTKNNFEDSVAKDLRKTYSANHWEAVRELFRSLGFTGIDDERILSDDQVKVAFETSREKFIEIRNQSLLLFGFKSRAKEMPDLKSAIKAINAIVGNWCGYTIKSERKLVGPKGQQIWKYSYQINRKPYNSRGFDKQEEVMARKLDNPEYYPIAPVLPSYKPKVSDEIQDLFDFIPITNNTTSECAEHRVSDSSSNAIYEKTLPLEVPTQNQPINLNRMECLSQYAIEHGEDPEQFSIVTEAEKKRWDEKCFRDELERDMRFYHSAVKQEEDPKKHLKLTDRDRLIGEELLRRGILESGLSTMWIDDLMKEWKKTISDSANRPMI